MTRIALVILLFASFLLSCGDDGEANATRGSEPPSDPISTTFDTIQLNKTTLAFVEHFDETTKDLPCMFVDRTGHEYYSHEFWYFNEKGEPIFFRGQWASETYVGAYYFSFKDSIPQLGFQFSENLDGTGSKIRYDSRMSPYYGYSISRELNIQGNDSIAYQQLTDTDLRNSRKELMGFLKANIAIVRSQHDKPLRRKGNDVIFTRTTPVYIEDVALTPDEEVITVNEGLLKIWQK